MTVQTFLAELSAHPEATLQFRLPNGGFIPIHAHLTEVGRVDKTFLDCGGTLRRHSTCQLQAWVAEDTDHRLKAGKLASIFAKAASLFDGDDLELEVEYQEDWISQFPVEDVFSRADTLTFQLGLKHTDCLAREHLSCGTPTSSAEEPAGCCNGSGPC
jgi:hypothetical protein